LYVFRLSLKYERDALNECLHNYEMSAIGIKKRREKEMNENERRRREEIFFFLLSLSLFAFYCPRKEEEKEI
jgi:hypothetical protein